MRVKIEQDFEVPGHPMFKAGKECDILDPIGEQLVERGLAIRVVENGKVVDAKENLNKKQSLPKATK